jgi:uncharacterized lipoprotein YajG
LQKNQNLSFKTRKEVIMKKIILPFVAVALLAACSESDTDSNFVAPRRWGEKQSGKIRAV